MKTPLILVLTTLALRSGLMACSWIPTSFCVTVNDRPGDAVISGRVMNVDADGMDLEVIDVLRGAEEREVIRIWDGTDFDCNGTFSMAASDLGAIGDSIIVVMPMIVAIENAWDVIGDYRRPDYFGRITDLRIINGVVLGYIAGQAMQPFDAIPYVEFVPIWAAGAIGCSDFLSVGEKGQGSFHLQNPVHDLLELDLHGVAGPNRSIRVHTMNGHVVLQRDMATSPGRIDVSGLPSGVYILEMIDPDGIRRSKPFVKA